MTVRAIWNGTVLAQSDDTTVVEGNHYFPRADVDARYLIDSDEHTTCPWKGRASYYTIRVGEATNPDAAWYYPSPLPAARRVKDRIAFWHGVEVVEDPA